MRAYRSIVAMKCGPQMMSVLRAKKDFHTAPQYFIQMSCRILSAATGGGGNSFGPPSTPPQPSKQSVSDFLTKYQAIEMIHKMNENERNSLREALEHYDSEQVKRDLEEIAANKWHARVGQHLENTGPISSGDGGNDSATINLVDGALRPSREDLYRMMLVNAVPFIGFGFLDNFFMIIAGDYIEHTLGVYMCISTMAAAGLGNTISDVLGLGLAHYVELFCEFIGLRLPRLTAAQLELKICRRVSSYGRALGITVGCLLGMFPLWFINKKSKSEVADDETINQTITQIV